MVRNTYAQSVIKNEYQSDPKHLLSIGHRHVQLELQLVKQTVTIHVVLSRLEMSESYVNSVVSLCQLMMENIQA